MKKSNQTKATPWKNLTTTENALLLIKVINKKFNNESFGS